MKILVAVKRVVDANIKVKIKSDGSDVEIGTSKMSMNPFDEIALEQAVQMKEKAVATEVIAVSIGEAKAADTLRVAMAMGADRAILVETEGHTEPLNVAKLLKAVVEKEQPDLVFLGKQAIDNDANQVGQMLAALCDMPQGTHASSAEIVEGKLRVKREIDGGIETVDLVMPAVVTADLRLNAPRYVTLPMMMKAKKKPLETIKAQELGVEMKEHLKLLKVETPAERKAGVILPDVDALIEKLKNEAKVL